MAFVTASLAASCQLFGETCSCEDEQVLNVCLGGKYVNSGDSILFVRERKNNVHDTLPGATASDSRLCFPEWGGDQRVIVYRDEDRVDSTSWFKQQKIDCCRYKDTTITF